MVKFVINWDWAPHLPTLFASYWISGVYATSPLVKVCLTRVIEKLYKTLMSYKTLTQIRSNKVLNSLKVAHEVFTWNGRKYHIVGRYGGHKWHGFGSRFGCTRSIPSQYRV